jgi:murein DD-endopeptidase MepM/ murein hydrolase activator NlpD
MSSFPPLSPGQQRLPFEPKVPSPRGTPEPPDGDITASADQWTSERIRPRDSLSKIFSRRDLPLDDLASVLTDPRARRALAELRVGASVHFLIAGEKLLGLSYPIDNFNTLKAIRQDKQFLVSIESITPETKVATAAGRITRSLFTDLLEAGVSERLIMQFADLFGWDVDFVRDIKRGDQFKIVFEEIFKNGEKVGNGKILAAEFFNDGKRHRAFYFSGANGADGYYNQSGEAMKKAFLLAPLNFTKVSSRFNLGRMHPILNRIRAHKGVDYAAPMGTPVRAVANGKIDFAGVQSGYGNVLVLKHGDRYSTLYGHMMKFASGISRGDIVKQGELIGYVGKTGLATGPHLHYEFRVDGVHVDPLTAKLPQAIPLEKKYLAEFHKRVAPAVSQLDTMSTDPVARRETVVSKSDGSPASSTN